jgi:DNA-binding HxlR family transcriptional regulator/putative sterol carrier protein
MGSPRYDDPCGIARAMAAIGDRWAVLVIRELMFGPKRFAQIRNGLAGISPNVLSQRLRELEAAEVVEHTVLPAPANVAVYELTDRGRALEPVLIELGRWGSALQNTSKNDLSVSAMMFSYKTVFDPAAARDGVWQISADGETFTVSISGGHIEVRSGATLDADVTFETDMTTLRAVSFGRESMADAEKTGRLRVSGDRRLAARFGRMFPVPVRR